MGTYIMISYAVIAPLILPLMTLYLAELWVVWRYQLL